MPSNSEKKTQGKRGVLNSAVMATLLGIIVSGILGFLGYLQHERAMLRDEIRSDQQWVAEQDKYAKQVELELTRYMQELQMKLHIQYLTADTIQELVRLEHSLEWLEKESPYEPTLPMVNSLRGFIRRDLETKLQERTQRDIGSKTDPSAIAQANRTVAKLRSISVAQEKQMAQTEKLIQEKAKKDQNIQVADSMAIRLTTGSDRRNIVLTEIMCIDPQSNWPKNCDQIYLMLNGKRIWKDPRKICQGERTRLNERLFFDDRTVLDLWEYDRVEDDHLGQFRFSENLNRSEGKAEIKGADKSGRWHYVFKFKAD